MRTITDENHLKKIDAIGYSVGSVYVLNRDVIAVPVSRRNNIYRLRIPGSFVPTLESFEAEPASYPDLILVKRGTEFTVTGFYYFNVRGVGSIIETHNQFSNGMQNVWLSAISSDDWSLGVVIPVPKEEFVSRIE
ncbi:MAG: hypothetical protein P5700_23625 [Arthrospira platensis PCC 7345]|nr:hypothetical protein [Arthrospira platensis PCC 7345]